jgi:predicted RNA binding protein YcfA (HicA-like mRNA interferase family)
MPKAITYRQLENILLQMGFSKYHTRGKHLVYLHRDIGARIVLPPPRLKAVPTIYIRAIGKTIDDYGLMTSEEFFRLIAEKEI